MIRKIKKIISYILLPVILIGKLHNNRILDLWNFIIIKFHTYRILSLFLNFGKNSLICTDFTTNHPESISIGDNCIINKHVILTCWNSKSHIVNENNVKIIIGDNCNIGEYNHITAVGKIEKGNGVLTGRWVTITDNSHGNNTCIEMENVDPIDREIEFKGAIKIGDRVWIGDKATILPGVRLGSGCVVAANSVVTKSFPENCIIGGVPAKLIKQVI